MTPEELERLAREAGGSPPNARRNFWEILPPDLARFAALVRAHALEEAARHFDKRDAGVGGFYEPNEPAEIIRALAGELVHGPKEAP